MNEQVLAVQRMQDYIEAHIDEEITMAELSKTALFSPWYSYRIFKAQTGLTPSDYIRRLRLSKSAMKLKNKACKIADIAFEMALEVLTDISVRFCVSLAVTLRSMLKFLFR